jgi:hypothetical protein
MKKLLTICIFIAITFSVNVKAQNASLNKQQTLEYIEKVFKANYESENDFKITEIKLEGKIFSWKCLGQGARVDLSEVTSLEIDPRKYKGGFVYNIIYKENNNELLVLAFIRVESDAKRLKKALEHLIEILKIEKNTDPLGE